MVALEGVTRRTAIDLFAGCGGVTVGLKGAGFRILAAVENDPAAVRVYRDNHHNVVLFGDIRELSARTLTRRLSIGKGDLDLLAGCPPCQGFSRMTTRNGCWRIIDPRNGLIDEFRRLVEGLLPKTIMLENVPGLASERRFTEFCQALRRQKYVVDFDVVDAADYGVPQRRRRLILLASRYGHVVFPKPAKGLVTVRDAIGALPEAGSSGDEAHDIPENRSSAVQRLIRLIPKNGGSRTDLGDHEQLRCHREFNGFKDVYGRMRWNDVAPTITSGCFNPSKGRFLHPTQNRCITIREAALLQSFPRKYRLQTTLGKSVLALLIGNALPPKLVQRHATAIRRHLDKQVYHLRQRRQ